MALAYQVSKALDSARTEHFPKPSCWMLVVRVLKRETRILILTTDNTSVWPAHNITQGPQVLSPAVELVLYDPDLSLPYAMSNDLASIIGLTAHGNSQAMIDVQHIVRESRKFSDLRASNPTGTSGSPPSSYYCYKTTTSSNPDLNLSCDAGLDPEAACYMTVTVRFSSMVRTTFTVGNRMTPVDVYQAIGAFFALIQLLSWIVSGMALSNSKSE